MNKVKTITIGLLSLLLVFLVSCGNKAVKLKTPTNLKVEGTVVVWDKVINADKYIIDINSEKFETETESFDFKDIVATKYNIKVQAVSDSDKFEDSNYSAVLVHEKTELEKLLTPVITLELGILSWVAVANAVSYEILVNEQTYSTTNTSYDLNEIVAATYNIKVKAVADNETYQNSDYSEAIIVNSENKMVLEVLDIIASSVEPVYGFIIELSFNSDYDLKEADINFTNIIPKQWIYDIMISDGEVIIAITGLNQLNLNFAQTILTITVSSEVNANIKLQDYQIDNGAFSTK